MAFYPGPGLGGHCIPLDPFYLTWKAREYDYHTKLIEVSSEINDYMPSFVVENATQLLNKSKNPVSGSKVLLMGLAYKKDIDDYRESPVLKIIELLELRGAVVMVDDPYIKSFKHKNSIYDTIQWRDHVDTSDIVIITTDHSCYDYDELAERAALIYDTRNAASNVRNNREKINKL